MTRKTAQILFTFCALAVLTATPAKAQDPELYFYPAQKWDIASSMPVDSADEGEICTIMTQYNNGFILSFSGQKGGISQIDIDFRQPVFQPGGTYNTDINIPGAFSRSIEAKAPQEQMISINVQNGSHFYDAVKRIGVLDLEIEKNEFRFYLTGINAASSRLDECMGISPVKTATIDTPDKPKELSEPPPLDVADMKPEEKPEALPEEAKRPEPPHGDRMADQMAAQMDQINKAEKITINDPVDPPAPAPEPKAEIPAEPVKTPQKQPRVARAVNTAPPATEPVKRPDYKAGKETVTTTPEPTVTSYTTPPIKETKTTYTAEIDFTDIEDKKPAEPAPVITTPEKKPTALEPVPVRTVETVPAVPPRSPIQSDAAIKALKIKNERLEQENKALNARLLSVMEQDKKAKASIASENWDLERATLRYNEAERQLENMGQKLQLLRAQCDQEKRALEAMLFDPAVTSQQQMAKLSGLQEEIRTLKQDMELQRRRYEEQIRLLQQQMMQSR